jgi:alpha-N-arabinofuranosidase
MRGSFRQVLLASFLATINGLCDHGPVRVEIDAQQVGTTISPLLFGHNLEVTRRAVWGGLGAEMVANRKFSAITNGLPKRWVMTESGVKAAIDNRVAYVGKNSIRLEIAEGSSGGLMQEQEALTFTAGKRYAFRWWLKTEQDRTVSMKLTDRTGRASVLQANHDLKAGDWQLWAGEFMSPHTAETARLGLTSKTPGVFWVGAVSMQPADNFHGMRRDVIALLKQIKPRALRFPGGCYAEFYRWEDGLLPVDRRPPIGPTGLDFLLRDSDDTDTQELGVDEFLALCREIGCEPAITLRLSESLPAQGASWVEYCNGGPVTTWGKLRAQRGHPEPFGVKTWFLGNELYFFGRGGMKDAVNCARETRAFAEAIRKVDPSVGLVGCTYSVDWNRPLLEQAGRLLNYASFHDYMQDSYKPRDLQSFAKAPTLHLRPKLQNFHKELSLPIVFDEWNTMWGNEGNVGMGLYAAGVLNLLVREAETLGIAQAYFFQPLTEGAVEVTPLSARLDTAGVVFELYRVHQGNLRLKTPDLRGDVDLDLCASVTGDRKKVFATAINCSTNSQQTVTFSLNQFPSLSRATMKLLVPRTLDPKERKFIERKAALPLLESHRVEASIPPCAIAGVTFE